MTGSRLAALFLALCALTGSAMARPFNQLWVFGDSTVDTGFYRKAPYSGEANYDFYIKQSAAAVGRPTSSPGPMSVEVLATAIGVTAKPANQPGTDYATGGARDAQTNTATSGGFPNAVRAPVRSTIIDSARSATPIARMAWWIRPGPRRAWATAKPEPSSPSSAEAGTRTSS